ncbi:hypothetical protein BRADI_1g63805v3 [Brachypodium distachyon]|uniref:Uncharacterized protein n=1 Tax=Brachypodium distachyon TaxID=15368 RepID=A0A0Q3HGT2_BRADI|nr:hypothetical protein BRADI_1g63805v3 [Brachypodium distachyon]
MHWRCLRPARRCHGVFPGLARCHLDTFVGLVCCRYAVLPRPSPMPTRRSSSDPARSVPAVSVLARCSTSLRFSFNRWQPRAHEISPPASPFSQISVLD